MYALTVSSTHYIHFCFFFNDTATTEIYTLSLHDALPISTARSTVLTVGSGETRRVGELPDSRGHPHLRAAPGPHRRRAARRSRDRKSTRLNSSHANISYAVFCLKKKTNTNN